jgi:hypothetical protein
MHVQLARIADCPELAMSEGDAKTLMGAAQNVLRHYSIQATQRAVDWLTFGSVAAFMYVPRAAALAKRIRRPEPQPQQQWGQVYQFVPPQPQPPQPQPPQAPHGAAVEPDYAAEGEQLH